MEMQDDRKNFESAFMADYWKLRKRLYNPEDSDTYWNDVVTSTNNLAAKYGEDEYIVQILLANVDDIERRAGSGKFSGKVNMCEFLMNRWRRERGLPRLVPEGVTK